jgi:putative transcriptional regulator
MAKKRKNVWDEVLDDMRSFARDLDQLPTEEVKAKYRHRMVKADLSPTVYTPAAVKAVRAGMQCSQTVFAAFIGVSPGTLRNWEQGIINPTGAACRLFDEMRLNPSYWKVRLTQEMEKRPTNRQRESKKRSAKRKTA